ncbi:4515_t:CDS:2, partial [Ambispora gerdemannii]
VIFAKREHLTGQMRTVSKIGVLSSDTVLDDEGLCRFKEGLGPWSSHERNWMRLVLIRRNQFIILLYEHTRNTKPDNHQTYETKLDPTDHDKARSFSLPITDRSLYNLPTPTIAIKGI